VYIRVVDQNFSPALLIEVKDDMLNMKVLLVSPSLSVGREKAPLVRLIGLGPRSQARGTCVNGPLKFS